MRAPKNTWPTDAEGRGVLFFAQLMAEMAGDATFESFRVYSLDTISRLGEAIRLVEDVEHGRLPRASLAPVLGELTWSLKNDPVAKKHLSREITAYFQCNTEQVPLDELFARVAMLGKCLERDYKAKIENILLESVADAAHRVAFRQACGSYCSFLINSGYSKRRIGEMVDRLYFNRSKPVVSLRRLFRIFDGMVKSFNVLVGVSDEFGQFLRSLGYNMYENTSVDPEILDALRAKGSPLAFNSYFERGVDAKDAYGAVMIVHQELGSVSSITHLDPTGIDCSWDDVMYVARIRIEKPKDHTLALGAALGKSTIMFPRRAKKPRTAGRRLKRIHNYTRRVIDSFDDPSRERLLSSINTAALAQTTDSPETQLISLWAAIEVLTSDPPPGPRILHYVRVLTPCIVSRHIRRQVIAIFDEMLIGYRRRFKKILAQETDYHDAHEKLAAILALPEHDPQRLELCTLCQENPLALHRLWKLHKELSSPSNVLAAMDGHYNRVEWQIQRIYRSRNELVHAGRAPKYLESLIVNLAEYYRSAVAAIVRKASREEAESDVDQIIAEVRFDYFMFRGEIEKLKGQAEMSRQDLQRLLNT